MRCDSQNASRFSIETRDVRVAISVSGDRLVCKYLIINHFFDSSFCGMESAKGNALQFITRMSGATQKMDFQAGPRSVVTLFPAEQEGAG